jgi:hypothetical protein
MYQEKGVESLQPQAAHLTATDLEAIRYPQGAALRSAGDLSLASVASIVGVSAHSFRFRENSSSPGRILEQSIVISLPPDAGAFTMISSYSSAFTTSDFRFLTERPLGEHAVALGFRGNNLVCQVRLTDSNQDDPIAINVTALVVAFN